MAEYQIGGFLVRYSKEFTKVKRALRANDYQQLNIVLGEYLKVSDSLSFVDSPCNECVHIYTKIKSLNMMIIFGKFDLRFVLAKLNEVEIIIIDMCYSYINSHTDN